MTDEARKELTLAIEYLQYKVKQVQKEEKIKLGETGAPLDPSYVEDDPLVAPVDRRWPALLKNEMDAAMAIIDRELAKLPKVDVSSFPKLDDSNLWVWGGPTPYWGGSMSDDTLPRNAKYYNAANGVYVYGPTNDKMMKLHSGFKKLLCQINGNCRTPGAQEGSTDEENAARLSRLSLEYPNVVGAMCDDVTTNFANVVLPEPFEARYRGLKKYNDKLKMYGVVYVHELNKDFSLIQPYMDVVTLWFWHLEELLEYDKALELCQKKFPGKKVLQGIFLHEYGRYDGGNPPQLLIHQLNKVREYMAKGVVEGAVILGDREIKKWPESAAAVRDYLLNQ